MAKITKEEVLRLAQMSKLTILDSEIDNVISELESVLNYAERVCEIQFDGQVDYRKNVNVTRPDQVIPTDYKPIMAQAPQSEDNYFIVPKILD